MHLLSVMSSVALHVHQAYKRIGDQHAEIQKVGCRRRARGVRGAFADNNLCSVPRSCPAACAARGSIWMTSAGRAGARTSQRGSSRARSVVSA